MSGRYLNREIDKDFDELKLGIAVTIIKAVSVLSSTSSCSVTEACIKLDVKEAEYNEAKSYLKEYGPEILTESEQKEVDRMLRDGLSVDEVKRKQDF